MNKIYIIPHEDGTARWTAYYKEKTHAFVGKNLEEAIGMLMTNYGELFDVQLVMEDPRKVDDADKKELFDRVFPLCQDYTEEAFYTHLNQRIEDGRWEEYKRFSLSWLDARIARLAELASSNIVGISSVREGEEYVKYWIYRWGRNYEQVMSHVDGSGVCHHCLNHDQDPGCTHVRNGISESIDWGHLKELSGPDWLATQAREEHRGVEEASKVYWEKKIAAVGCECGRGNDYSVHADYCPLGGE